jgi:hypothetical protein
MESLPRTAEVLGKQKLCSMMDTPTERVRSLMEVEKDICPWQRGQY